MNERIRQHQSWRLMLTKELQEKQLAKEAERERAKMARMIRRLEADLKILERNKEHDDATPKGSK